MSYGGLSLALVVVIGVAMHATRGGDSAGWILLVTAAFALWLRQSRRDFADGPQRVDGSLLPFVGIAGAFFGALVVVHPALLHAVHPRMLLGAQVATAVSAACFALAARNTPRSRPALLAAAVALTLAHVLIPFASPHPVIDVFTSNTAGADHLLAGRNPYSQTYDDIYRGHYDYPPGIPYFPATLEWMAPFRGLLGDIRYGLLASTVLSALALAWATSRAGRVTLLPPALGALWLAFPVSLFVLEQSWVDPILAMATGVMAVALQSRRYLFAGLLLGFACAVKQPALLIAVPTLAWVLGAGGKRAGAMMVGGAFVAFALLVGPLLATEPEGFLRMTLRVPLSQAARDSFTLVSLGAQIGIGGAARIGALIAAAATIAIAVFAFVQGRGRQRLADWANLVFATHVFAFLFGKQAFCNYYALAAYFLLLAIGLGTEPASIGGVSEPMASSIG